MKALSSCDFVDRLDTEVNELRNNTHGRETKRGESLVEKMLLRYLNSTEVGRLLAGGSELSLPAACLCNRSRRVGHSYFHRALSAEPDQDMRRI